MAVVGGRHVCKKGDCFMALEPIKTGAGSSGLLAV